MGRPIGSKNGVRNVITFTCSVCGKKFKRWSCHRKGKTIQCSMICRNKSYKKKFVGANNGMWKYNRLKKRLGYVFVVSSYKTNSGYMQEHRYVMEQHIGRKLKPSERIHHINGIKHDNRIDNLILLPNQSEHQKLHCKLKYEYKK